MKKIILAGIVAVTLCACTNSTNQTLTGITSTDTAVAKKPVPTETTLPAHTDDGKAYFAYIVKKGDSLVNKIISEKPVAFQGSKNMILQLDSSHRLLVNGSGLNIYLNEKSNGEYPIASGTGKKEASILGAWLEKDESRTSYSVQQGTVNITRFVNDTCSGNFRGTFKRDGADYLVMGEFLHVKVN